MQQRLKADTASSRPWLISILDILGKANKMSHPHGQDDNKELCAGCMTDIQEMKADFKAPFLSVSAMGDPIKHGATNISRLPPLPLYLTGVSIMVCS